MLRFRNAPFPLCLFFAPFCFHSLSFSYSRSHLPSIYPNPPSTPPLRFAYPLPRLFSSQSRLYSLIPVFPLLFLYFYPLALLSSRPLVPLTLVRQNSLQLRRLSPFSLAHSTPLTLSRCRLLPLLPSICVALSVFPFVVCPFGLPRALRHRHASSFLPSQALSLLFHARTSLYLLIIFLPPAAHSIKYPPPSRPCTPVHAIVCSSQSHSRAKRVRRHQLTSVSRLI